MLCDIHSPAPWCRLRVTGVPAFFIRSGASKTYVVSGAQPVEMFLEAFRKALAEGGTNAAEAE